MPTESPSAQLDKKFWPKIDSSGPGGCWLWTGGRTGPGYGALSIDGAYVYAHRASYEIHHGPIKEGMCVCHHCDVPACVNPEHLFLGTHRDNMRDKAAKGRVNAARGEDSGMAKLTKEDVLSIRADRRLQRTIAADYGISQPLVSMVKGRKLWSHVS